MNAPASEPALTWPAERFYWAMVPGAPWKGSGELPAGLLALAEDDLPVPADTLHAVGAPVDGGVLVCAIPQDDLLAVPESVLSLRPTSAPAGVAADCSRLNLLVGRYEPRPIRRARVRRHALASGTVLVCSLLASIGLARRSWHWSEAAAADKAAWTSAAMEVAPASDASIVLFDLQRRASRLDHSQEVRPPADAALVLMTLLEHWPAQVSSKPQSITIRGRDVSVTVIVQDAPAFLAALVPPQGWGMDQPMLNTSGDLTRLSLTFHAAEPSTELAVTETGS